MARTTQRDVMRNLHRRFDGDHDKVVAAYAVAERRGDVKRASTGAELVRAVAAPSLVLLALVAVGACAESYPGEVTAPELVGLVTSSTTDKDLTAHIVLSDGTELVIPRSDRVLGGFGELLVGGTKPEQWYLGGHASEKPDCYRISAHKAYAEDGTVVLAFEEWPGVGLRLPKAPGYVDSKLVTADSSGRLVYSAIGPVSLCVDEQGRVNGLG